MKKNLLFVFSALIIFSCNTSEKNYSYYQTLIFSNKSLINSNERVALNSRDILNEFEMYYQLSKSSFEKTKLLTDETHKIILKTATNIDELIGKLITESGEDKAMKEKNGKLIIYFEKLENPGNSISLDEESRDILIADLEKIFDHFKKLSEKFIYSNEESFTLLIKENLGKYIASDRVTEIFETNTLIETISVLLQIQSDLYVSENIFLSYLMTAMTIDIPMYGCVKANFEVNSNVINVSDTLKSDIYLVMYDTLAKPEIFIGNFDPDSYKLIGKEGKDWFKLENNNKGGATYLKAFDSPGVKQIKGFIKVGTPNGDKCYPFKKEITVVPKK